MESSNTYKYITGAATTLLGGTETTRVILDTISINKATTGTVTIKAGGGSGTTIGIIPIGVQAGVYFWSGNGTEIENPAIINSASEDVTVFYRNI